MIIIQKCLRYLERYLHSEHILSVHLNQESCSWESLNPTVYFCFTLDKHRLITGGHLSEAQRKQRDKCCHISSFDWSQDWPEAIQFLA